MKRILIGIGLALSGVVVAQSRSDGTITEGDYGLVRTNIQVACDHTWGSLRDGFNARVSYQCFKNRYFSVTLNGRYNSLSADFEADELPQGYDPEAMCMNDVHVTGQAGLSATARTSLFHKPLLAFATLNTDWGIGGYERTSAMLMGLLLLRYNRDTQFGIGPLVMLHSTSKVPAFLVFMYRHRFSERWLLNLYGGMLGLDYTPTRNDLFAIGGDIDVKYFFFRPQTDGLPGKCQYRKSSFRPMMKYRRRLRPNFYFEAEGGVTLSMSSRVTGTSGTKEYLSISQKPSPFLQVSISYAL